MTIAEVSAQRGGGTFDNVSQLTYAFPSNVTAGSLIVVAAPAFRSDSSLYSAGDCTKSAGTATLSTFTLDKQQSDTVDSGFNAVWSAIVTGSGSLTVAIAVPTGSYGVIAADEFTGNWDNTRVETSNGATTIADSTPTSGNATSVGAALFFGSVAVHNSSNDGLTPDTPFTNIYSEIDGSTHVVGGAIFRIVSSGTTDEAGWTLTAAPVQAEALVVIYREAAGASTGKSLNTPGPGISPNKRTQFQARILAGAPPLTIGVLAGTAALLFGQSGTLDQPPLTGRPTMTGPGISPDYLKLFRPRTLSTTLQSTGPISGSDGIIFGQSGTLTGSGALSGTAAITFGQTGVLTGMWALTGTNGLLFGQSGTLLGNGALAGIDGLVFGQSGTLAGSAALSGTNGIVFSATATADQPAGAMSGTGAITLSQSGTLLGDGSLSGTAALLFNAIDSTAPPVIDAIQASGSVPGVVKPPRKRKSGPVMRKGQVFGEEYAVSPFLDAQNVSRETIVKQPKTITKAENIPVQDATRDAIVLLLHQLL